MIHIFGKGIKTVLICLLFIVGMIGCKDDYNSNVPDVPVDLIINPSNIIELNIPGGSFYFEKQGFGGVIVFRDLIDSSNPFLAFDATCTHEIISTCRVEATDPDGLVTCKCCGSQYILFNGSGNPTKGPAIEALKQYRTYYTNGVITVRN